MSRSKILAMIDDRMLLEAVQKALESCPCDFSLPEDNLMQKIFDEVPHLLIIDENFRDGEGREVWQGMKSDMVLKHIPVILLVERDIRRPPEEERGANFYFHKKEVPQNLYIFVCDILNKNYNELDLNPLTYLPGSRSTVLRIESAIGSEKHFAVCYVDLSNLAAFNDAYGITRGDQVIIRLSEVIRDALKKEGSGDDFLGHVGSDDFVVVTHTDTAAHISEEIIRRFDADIPSFYDARDRKLGYLLQRNKEGVLTLYPMMSVSIAVVHNEYMPIREAAEVNQIAEELKGYIKSLPGSHYIKDRRRLHRGFNDWLEEEGGKSHAEAPPPDKVKSVRISGHEGTEKYLPMFYEILRDRKIHTLYQPIVRLSTKEVIGYEALTRGPEGTPFYDPMFLFNIARKVGQLKELDKICVECALSTAQGLGTDQKLFLNLNLETLIDVETMKELFACKGHIGYKNVVIEVTEQSILRSFDLLRDALVELRDQGVSVAIDDVGGGAVSLRDVALLRPDFMKFDRTLIRQIDSNPVKQQIILSMILFARGIKSTTVAEGVETPAECQAIINCGMELCQGYYFAKPGKPFPRIAHGVNH